MGKKRRKRVECPNCQKQLKEEMNYCFNCGQENHVRRVSMKMLTADFVSTYFSADSKLFSSLKYLITRPSFLSLEYLNGKIEAYLRPIRLYVFISFAFFLLLGITSSNDSLDGINFTKNGEKVSIEQIENDVKNNTSKENQKQVTNKPSSFEEELETKFNHILSSKKEANYFYNYFKSKLPILLFIIIPVLAGLLFICFYKKEYYYIDHLVFALHLQTFLFVLLIITTLFNWITKIDIQGLAVLGLLIYGFIAAKKFYKRSKLATLFRLIAVGVLHAFFSMIILTVFFLLVVKSYSI